MNKSHVSMGVMLCPVCGCKHSETTLLQKQLKEVFHESSTEKVDIEYELCSEHRKIHEQGYVALVEIDPDKSDIDNGVFYHTGNIAFMLRGIAKKVFIKRDISKPIIRVEIGVLQELQKNINYTKSNNKPPSIH